MKSIKTYQRMKKLTASILVPVSLVGIINLTGCKIKEPAPIETTPIDTAIDVKENDSQIPYLRELQAITQEIVHINVKQDENKENIISISIQGLKRGNISDEAYTIWNNLLNKLGTYREVYVHLTDYQNQIDFTRLTWKKDAAISIFINNSKNVNLDGLMKGCNTILPNNSSVQNIDEVANCINQNGGNITFDRFILKENFVNSIECFFQNLEVPFSKVCLFAFNSDETKDLNSALSKVKTDLLLIGECESQGEISISDNIKSLAIIYSSPQLKISANKDTIAFIYQNHLTEEYLNSPLVHSLQNVSILDLYFTTGPILVSNYGNTVDLNVEIMITQEACILLSGVNGWELVSHKTEDGFWKMEIVPKPTIEKTLAKIL